MDGDRTRDDTGRVRIPRRRSRSGRWRPTLRAPTNGDPLWVKAWAAVTPQRRAGALRRAVIRVAFNAANKVKSHSPDEVKGVLEAETTGRGITDLTPRQLEYLTGAVLTSPRRAALSVAWAGLRAVGAFTREVRAHSVPSWTNTPNKTQRLEWRADQNVVRAVVELDPNADTIVAQPLDDDPAIWGETVDGAEPVTRFFPCWIDVGPADEAAATVTVHVGKYVLGRLRAGDAVVVRQLLATARYAALELDARVVDGDPRSVRVGLPDRV